MTTVDYNALDYNGLSDEILSDLYEAAKDERDRAKAVLDRIESEAVYRAAQTGGTMVGRIKVSPGTPTYDVGRLLAAREEMGEAEWRALVIQSVLLKDTELSEEAWPRLMVLLTAWAPDTTVHTKADGTKANALVRKYGEHSPIGTAILAAKSPGLPRVSIEEAK